VLVVVCLVVPGALLAVVLTRHASSASTTTGTTSPMAGEQGPVSTPGVATVGSMAPDFTLTDLSGRRVRLSDYRGRPVLVSFWASWCIPCRDEVPLLQQAYLQHRAEHLALLGVTFRDLPSDSRRFLRAHHATYPALPDTDGAVATAYGVRAVPQLFFIGRDGRIRDRIYGRTGQALLDRTLREILPPS